MAKSGGFLSATLALLLALASLVFASATAMAQTDSEPGIQTAPQAPEPLRLDPAQSTAGIGSYMRFALDEGAPLVNVIRSFTAGQLSDDFAAVSAAAQPYQPIWAMVEVENTAPQRDRPPDSWILASDINGLITLDVFLFRLGAGTEQLLAHDSRAPFNPSDYSTTRLRSAPVMLAAGERALLLVRLTHGPSPGIALSLETPSDHQARSFLSGLLLSGFYAFLASSLVFFAIFNAAMRSDVGAAYALLLALGLLFIAYLDNFLFRLVYPQSPAWHLPVGIGLLLLISAVGAATAARSLKRFASHAWGRVPLLVLATLATLSLLLVVRVEPEIMAPVAYVFAGLMLAGQIFAVFRWDAMTGARGPVFRAVALCAFAGLGLLILLILLRADMSSTSVGWSIKAIYAVIALGTMSGLSVGLIDVRREATQALEREMIALANEAERARDLLEAERNYSRARDMADRRRQQLASMSHDIRQPLASLRMTMEAMTQDSTPEVRARLGEAFDYMSGLTRDHLDDTKAEALEEAAAEADAAMDPGARPQDRALQEDKTEPYPISLIQDTVTQMFREEAISKGLRLRVVPSSVSVTIPPLALMRVTSNLVSNAVKYTEEGRVLIGVRRRVSGPELQILDTGAGMSREELSAFRSAWQSGDDSEGHGLGLAIVHNLAAQHGIEIEVQSLKGRGTRISLHLPDPTVLASST